MPKTASGTSFREQVQSRLVDTWDVMMAFDLRSKQAVMARVVAGKLPEPVIVKASIVSLWDAEEVEEMTGVRVTPTDRKED